MKKIEQIRNICNCNKCDDDTTLKVNVTGKGNTNSKIMIIDKYTTPEYDSNKLGTFISYDYYTKLFVKTIEEILKTNMIDLYYTRCIKCISIDDFDNIQKPKSKHYRNCRDILLKEIDIVNPDYILVLGSHPLKTIFSKGMLVNNCRNKITYLFYNAKRYNIITTVHYDSFYHRNDNIQKFKDDINYLKELMENNNELL